MIIRKAELETVCGYTSKLPDHDKPEIAFAGKSNVGKSSLINCLLERKSLARTSSSPGKTQTINFYNVNDRMYLTDLPGYGYAKITLTEKEKWGEMIERYLHESPQLCAVFLLLDIRHAPQENDIRMYEWMDYQGYAPIIIATKKDKIKKTEVDRQLNLLRDTLDLPEDAPVIPFSAETREGREEVWNLMEQLIGYEKETEAEEPVKTRNPEKKPRWKDTGRTSAKKTVKQRRKKQEKTASRKKGKAGKHK
jgi:GTP-binding protein